MGTGWNTKVGGGKKEVWRFLMPHFSGIGRFHGSWLLNVVFSASSIHPSFHPYIHKTLLPQRTVEDYPPTYLKRLRSGIIASTINCGVPQGSVLGPIPFLIRKRNIQFHENINTTPDSLFFITPNSSGPQ